MLSKTQMVKARKAIETMYDGTCNIIEYQKIKKANMSTGFQNVTVLENEPCRLSFKTIGSTVQTGNIASAVTQVITLFISPDVVIKPGSKIVVTQNNKTTEYKHSGESAVYGTHQEIILELFKGWA